MSRVSTATLVCCVAACMLLVPASSRAAAPTSTELLSKAIAAAGGQKALDALGVLEVRAEEEQTRADGTTTKSSTHAFVSGGKLQHLRLEEAGGWVLVRAGLSGWASQNGQADSRPQTPLMASGTVAQRMFPLLLPFSLGIDGVQLSEPTEATFEGKPAWRLGVTFPKGFFQNPILVTRWDLYLARTDLSLLSLEFRPSPEYARTGAEGVRYRVLTSQKVGGCSLPANLLTEGVDAEGGPSGHFRVTKVTAAVRGPWDPALFLSPQQLKEIEGEE